MKWSRVLASLLALCVPTVVGCGSPGGSVDKGSIAETYDLGQSQLTERGGGDTTRLTVGSKDFEEQEILGQITLRALDAAGAEVVDDTALGGTEAVRSALTSAQIDMYWEYTGTGALIHLARADYPTDPQELFGEVAELDRQRNGIVWLEPAPANNTYAIAVREDAEPPASDVDALSDLAAMIEETPDAATLCVGPEFNERADGLPGLAEQYGLEFPQAQVFVLPDNTVYGAVADGQKCNFGSVFETNGLIPELGLRLLDDDESFFAAYNPSLTMRAETLDRYPDIEPLFADIAKRLDTTTLRDLSAQVLVDRRAPEDVAEDWMSDEGLIE